MGEGFAIASSVGLVGEGFESDGSTLEAVGVAEFCACEVACAADADCVFASSGRAGVADDDAFVGAGRAAGAEADDVLGAPTRDDGVAAEVFGFFAAAGRIEAGDAVFAGSL